MSCYWDTSALLGMIFPEARAAELDRLAARNGLPAYTSFFTLLEMESAYSRRLAAGALSVPELAEMRLRAQKLEASLVLVWPDPERLDSARRIVLEFGLRAGDALQLASAQAVLKKESGTRFVSLDAKLNDAARAAGLTLALPS